MIRAIAFYLPQYYPTVENDEWWGKGFTEWTNVGKARKLFPGHYQPKVPADLGYYDLRIPAVRQAQADLAKTAGIEGFCYWHYWFAGRRLLEKPLQEVKDSGHPDFPFCVCWANHSWYAKTWRKDVPDKLLIEQTYPGDADCIAHFHALLPYFKDERYIKVNNKPVFGIFDHKSLPDAAHYLAVWNRLARENGLDGIHFFTLSFQYDAIGALLRQGFDGVVYDLLFKRENMLRYFALFCHKVFKLPSVIRYEDYAKTLVERMPVEDTVYPCVIPNFDHTPRSGNRGSLLTHSTPDNWGKLLDGLFSRLAAKPSQTNLVFIKSWNEWGEGNYMEPDLRYGRAYLDRLREMMDKYALQ